MKEWNSNKPLGPSNIPAWASKDCMNIVAEPLQFLIIAFIFEGSFPQHLEQAHITPIFKSGDAENSKKLPTDINHVSISKIFRESFERVNY